MTTSAVRVVTVAFNPGHELESFASSLREATSDGVTLVIVDNGSQSHVVDDVARRHDAQVLRPGANLGYGAAANLGARDGQEPWVVVANPDIVWRPGSLDALLDAASRNERAGSLGPRILNTDGTVYPSARAIPSLTQGAGHAVFVRVWPSNPWTRRYHQRQERVQHSEHAVGWLPGAGGRRLRRALLHVLRGRRPRRTARTRRVAERVRALRARRPRPGRQLA